MPRKVSAPEIKLLIADVDGTLVTPEKVLTEAARDAVRDLHKAGIAVSITSGRPPRGMRMLIEPLALSAPIAGFNGGIFVGPDFSTISCHLLAPHTARRALDTMLGRGMDAWVYTESAWLIRNDRAPHVEREQNTVQFAPEIVDEFTEEHLKRAVKIVAVSDDEQQMTACSRKLQATLGDTATVELSQPYYLDVTSPKANKAMVVETLSHLLEIETDGIATIGDMPNDVLMFRASALSIAMGNASDEVKAKASAVTESNTEDGFARAVRRYILS